MHGPCMDIASTLVDRYIKLLHHYIQILSSGDCPFPLDPLTHSHVFYLILQIMKPGVCPNDHCASSFLQPQSYLLLIMSPSSAWSPLHGSKLPQQKLGHTASIAVLHPCHTATMASLELRLTASLVLYGTYPASKSTFLVAIEVTPHSQSLGPEWHLTLKAPFLWPTAPIQSPKHLTPGASHPCVTLHSLRGAETHPEHHVTGSNIVTEAWGATNKSLSNIVVKAQGMTHIFLSINVVKAWGTTHKSPFNIVAAAQGTTYKFLSSNATDTRDTICLTTGIPHLHTTIYLLEGVQQSQGIALPNPMSQTQEAQLASSLVLPEQRVQLRNLSASRMQARFKNTPTIQTLNGHASSSRDKPTSSSPLL
jgi:hypothetical protein